jgi:transcriptional regulator with XRE-family HTH domain
MGSPEHLAAFLRARREQIDPEDVGIVSTGPRRVPGLRREELAALAGISPDYYMRLEQGRDHRPSEQVLDALARALQLDDDTVAYLYKLARPAPQLAAPDVGEAVSPEIQDLLDAWEKTPALVQNRRLDTLASNTLAQALSPALRPGANSLRAVFLDPVMQAFYADLPLVQRRIVAYVRAKIGDDFHDPELIALLDELQQNSQVFSEIWGRHKVLGIDATGDTGFLHPEFGIIYLRYWTLSLPGADGFTLLIYNAAPGSFSAQALIRLALSATS